MNRKKGIDMPLQNDDKLFDEKQLATEWWEKHQAFAYRSKTPQPRIDTKLAYGKSQCTIP